MRVSLKQLRFYQQRYNWASEPASEGVEALAQKVGRQLGAIEEIIDLGRKYQGIVVAKVISCAPHPDSDHLSICKIDDSSKVQNVERDERGLVQVVCGAPNVREGLMVAWLPPGATVPDSVNKEHFVLEARPIRGVTSSGMLASQCELGLGDSHDGVLEIDEPTQPGDDFAQLYGLDDHIFDIENKMFTHRPDCFGLMGVAREIAGIQQQAFKSPDWYTLNPTLPSLETEELKLEVRNELPELVPRFTAITMRNVAVKPSPLWLQIELIKAGLRPINNVVDLTNYYMLLTAQPLHAYDYDKVKDQDAGADRATLVVRFPKSGERLRLLNGKDIEPKSGAIMIATNQCLIGVGGVMGGGDTEVDDSTKNIILECANFDMYSIRRTAMDHGLFTDAVTRFSKGQSPLQNRAVLAKIVNGIKNHAAGQVAGTVIDDNRLGDRAWVHPPVPVSVDFINSRLGLTLSADEMKRLLENVEFRVEVNGDSLVVTAPFWRTDVEMREDVVEEVGRLYGYDKVPLLLPSRTIRPAPRDQWFDLKSRIRHRLSAAGANEVLTYSFVHGNLLDKVGQSHERAFQLSNALSPDLQYYRLSLTPSLLEKVHPNIKTGYEEFALFEIGKTHCLGVADKVEPDLPQEDMHLALVLAVNDKAARDYSGAPYYLAKRYLKTLVPNADDILRSLNGFDFAGDIWGKQMCAPYEPSRSAVLIKDDLVWGVVGEFQDDVCRALKLPQYAAGFELGIELVRDAPQFAYKPLPHFPKLDQDICLKVSAATTYAKVLDTVKHAIEQAKPKQTVAELQPVDIYQRQEDQASKQITLRISIASYERTLTDSEVSHLLDGVAITAKEQLGAERV